MRKNSHRASAENRPSDGAATSLKSLAPEYVEGQHKTYLDRLEDAVKDEKNLNIALSGPYGTGKSSILNEFQKQHQDETVRLAISTLAPAEEQTSLTNRIQKEIVKQLLYGAKPATQRNSRFSPISPVSKTRGVLEGTGLVVATAVVLWFLGRLPVIAGTSVDNPPLLRAAAALVFAAVLIATYAALRVSIFNRFVISDVSAAGASVTLSKRSTTYFDEYLDEIVYFFNEEPKNIVILEDLDRFDDHHIFEALRELNTLLNSTAKRRGKSGKPLRFVYAMKDSLFEKLGDDTKQESVTRGDAAAAENLRANRTKFFDIVIPVVPFISHRNSRELLSDLLVDAHITDIDRELVALIAKHTTDMRLLVNMRNEYLVFAERLLEPEKCAPGLRPSTLFALIAYKNFHMNDFEQIARHGSDLDALYDFRRTLVRTCVAEMEDRKRELQAGAGRPRSLGPFAQRMGERLVAVCRFQVERSIGTSFGPWFRIASTSYGPNEVMTAEFWEAVAENRSIDLQGAQRQGASPQHLGTMNQQDLEELFPEALKDNRWVEKVNQETATELDNVDSTINFLRGADFAALAYSHEFGMPEGDHQVTFLQHVDVTLQSQLAKDLVTGGYIDRNFALYAAQFYGNFTGVDVATFIVQNVQNNTMELDYQFHGHASIANLLKETRGDDFVHTTAAYNVQILNYLLVGQDPHYLLYGKASDELLSDEMLSEQGSDCDVIVDHLIADPGDQAREFLKAYFASGNQQAQLAGALSRREWLEVFTYLVETVRYPVDLIDAALLAAAPGVNYHFRSDVADFVTANYTTMSAFTEPQNDTTIHTLTGLLERADVSLPDLGALDGGLRSLVIDRHMYDLTTANLRTALGLEADEPVALDKVRENRVVYENCLNSPEAYLRVAAGDPMTPHVILTPEVLAGVLTDIDKLAEDDVWEATTLSDLLGAASPDSELTSVRDAPTSTWQALATAKLFRASLANLEAYRAELGEIDEPLGELLVTAGAIETSVDPVPPEPDDRGSVKEAAALALLNASAAIPSPEDRVRLVESLDLSEPLPAGTIPAEPSNLFALLITKGLVPDDAATFSHLATGGWPAVMPAILASSDVATFLQPDHVDDMIADVLKDTDVAEKVGSHVLSRLAEFQPNDNAEALRAAAQFAIATATALPVGQIERVAIAVMDADLTFGLLRVAKPVTADTVKVLDGLVGDYNFSSLLAQDEFEVPNDEDYRAVYKALEKDGWCQIQSRQRGGKRYLLVKRP